MMAAVVVMIMATMVAKVFIEALEGLPPSIRQRPVTVATLWFLYGALGMEEKVEEILVFSSSDDQGPKIWIRSKMYNMITVMMMTMIRNNSMVRFSKRWGSPCSVKHRVGRIVLARSFDQAKNVRVLFVLFLCDVCDAGLLTISVNVPTEHSLHRMI